MEFTGKIIWAGEKKTGTTRKGEQYAVQEFVIENNDDTYPRKMVFEVFGADRLKKFGIRVGEELTVSFDIDAREWKDRWFNSIRAWNIERDEEPAIVAPEPEPIVNSNPDDLPF